MKKGFAYKVSNGTIKQAFDGDDVHVVDVAIDAGANKSTSVEISSTGPVAVEFSESGMNHKALLISKVNVYDFLGNLVRILHQSAADQTKVKWDARDQKGVRVTPGVYFFKSEQGLERRIVGFIP